MKTKGARGKKKKIKSEKKHFYQKRCGPKVKEKKVLITRKNILTLRGSNIDCCRHQTSICDFDLHEVGQSAFHPYTYNSHMKTFTFDS